MTGILRPSIVARRTAWAVGAAALLCAVPPAPAQIVDRVEAVVGSKVLTASDVRAAEAFGFAGALPAVAGATGVLASLVARELILGEVDRYAAPDPDAAAVEPRLARMRARFATRELYDQALARTAMTDLRLRAIVAENLRIEHYLEQRFGAAAQPTVDEMRRYYREHPAEFTRAGSPLPFEEVQQSLQQKLAGARRAELIADWLDRLQRRATVRIVQRGQ